MDEGEFYRDEFDGSRRGNVMRMTNGWLGGLLKRRRARTGVQKARRVIKACGGIPWSWKLLTNGGVSARGCLGVDDLRCETFDEEPGRRFGLPARPANHGTKPFRA